MHRALAFYRNTVTQVICPLLSSSNIRISLSFVCFWMQQIFIVVQQFDKVNRALTNKFTVVSWFDLVPLTEADGDLPPRIPIIPSDSVAPLLLHVQFRNDMSFSDNSIQQRSSTLGDNNGGAGSDGAGGNSSGAANSTSNTDTSTTVAAGGAPVCEADPATSIKYMLKFVATKTVTTDFDDSANRYWPGNHWVKFRTIQRELGDIFWEDVAEEWDRVYRKMMPATLAGRIDAILVSKASITTKPSATMASPSESTPAPSSLPTITAPATARAPAGTLAVAANAARAPPSNNIMLMGKEDAIGDTDMHASPTASTARVSTRNHTKRDTAPIVKRARKTTKGQSEHNDDDDDYDDDDVTSTTP